MYEPRVLKKGPFRIGDIAVELCGEPWRANAQYDAVHAGNLIDRPFRCYRLQLGIELRRMLSHTDH